MTSGGSQIAAGRALLPDGRGRPDPTIRHNGQQFGQDRPRRIVSGSISVRRLPRPRPMKIVQLEVIPLCGGTVDGGWPEAHKLEDDLHALIEITTDSGLTGIGSCFTSGRLVNGA